MNNEIKISIITASYNYANYIQETIKSVQAQTYDNWEMIIVDDGSTDNSAEVIQSFANNDKRIKLFRHDGGINKGLTETLKLGIEKAQGSWLVFLESDDTIEPLYLEEKINVINKYPEVGLIFNDINFFGDKESITKFDTYREKQAMYLRDNQYPLYMYELFKKSKINLIPTFSVVMLKKECLDGIDFDCPFKPSLDWYLWIQLLKKCQFYYINKPLTNWRIHKTSWAQRKTNNFWGKAFFEYKKNLIFKEKFATLKFLLALATCIQKSILRIFLKKNYYKIELFNRIVIEKTEN